MKCRLAGSDARLRLFAPAFLVAALAGPNLIFLTELIGQTSTESFGALHRADAGVQIFGLTLLLIGAALTTYRWASARRLTHLCLLLILLDVFYRIAYGGPVSPGLLRAVPQTSQRETLELLAGHPALTVSLSLVALCAVLALVGCWNTVYRASAKARLWLVGVGLGLIALSAATAVMPFPAARACCGQVLNQAMGVFPIDVAVSFGSVAHRWYGSSRSAAARSAFRFPNPHLRQADTRRGREIYVIVVGETSRSQDWSLFGYGRPTNPELEKKAAELVRYRALSNATNTILSLPMALTRATPATRDLIQSEKSVVSLLKEAGFETFWISNQERPGLASNPIAQIALEAQHVSFHGEDLRTAAADRFDSNLLMRLDAAIAQLPGDAKAVMFLHMEGSHFSYKERYPPQFEVFAKGDDLPANLSEHQRQLINQYDNSIAFTDHLLGRVIDRLTACDCDAGMVFFSDHGERLFDNGTGDDDFGHGFPEIARQEIEIPLIVWLSPALQRLHPLLASRARVNARWTAELHDLFETIVDLTGVDYDGRDADLSLFSETWRPPSEVAVLSLDDRMITFPANNGAP